MTTSLSAFLLASHRDDVTSKHVGDGFKRLTRQEELNPHKSRVILFSWFKENSLSVPN